MLAVQADGTTWIGSRATPLKELGPIIAEWQQENPSGKIVIRSDRETPYAVVRQVMRLCRDAGLSDIIFASYQSDT
jgi:biopolymer transport protein ExbD